MITRLTAGSIEPRTTTWAYAPLQITQVGIATTQNPLIMHHVQARIMRSSGVSTTVYGVALGRSGSEPRTYSVFIDDLKSDSIALKHSIPVALELWEGVTTAHSADVDVFGTGTSEFSALDDFRLAFVELYDCLKREGEANLGPLMVKQWRYLRKVVEER